MNEDEAGFITLHLAAARENQDVKATLRLTNAINDVLGEIEKKMHLSLREGNMYRLSVEHLRSLIARSREGRITPNPLLSDIEAKLPEEVALAERIAHRLSEQLSTSIAREEIGYLAVYLHRLKAAAE